MWLTSLSAQHSFSTANRVVDILLLCTARAKACRSRGECTWSLCSCMFYLNYTVSFQTWGKSCFISIQPCILLMFGASGQHTLFFFSQQSSVNWWGACLCLLKLELSYPTAWPNDCMLLFQGYSSKDQDKYVFLNVFTPREGQFALTRRFQTSVLQVKLLEERCLDSYIIPFGIIYSFSAMSFCIYSALIVFVHIVLLHRIILHRMLFKIFCTVRF